MSEEKIQMMYINGFRLLMIMDGTINLQDGISLNI